MFSNLLKNKTAITQKELVDNLNDQISILKDMVRVKDEMLALKDQRIQSLEQALENAVAQSQEMAKAVKDKADQIESAVIEEAIKTEEDRPADMVLLEIYHRYDEAGMLQKVHPLLSGFWSDDKELFKKIVYKSWNSIWNGIK